MNDEMRKFQIQKGYIKKAYCIKEVAFFRPGRIYESEIMGLDEWEIKAGRRTQRFHTPHYQLYFKEVGNYER